MTALMMVALMVHTMAYLKAETKALTKVVMVVLKDGLKADSKVEMMASFLVAVMEGPSVELLENLTVITKVPMMVASTVKFGVDWLVDRFA